MKNRCPECGGRLSAELECLRCGECFEYCVSKLKRMLDKNETKGKVHDSYRTTEEA